MIKNLLVFFLFSFIGLLFLVAGPVETMKKMIAALEYMKVRTQSDLKIAGNDDRWVRRTDLIVPARGNTAAVSDLDMVYLEDRVVRKTDPEAIKWLLRAAYHGNPEAQ